MAFREPMGFSPAAASRRTSPKKTAGKPRRRAAVVGGVGRASPASKKPIKEKRPMAKRKKARTPAQKRATAKMLAANKRARSTPTKAKSKAKPKAKKIGVNRTPSGRQSVKVKKGTKITRLTKPAARLRTNAQKAAQGRVTRTYKKYKSGKHGVIIRENPANRSKAIMGAAVGFGLGIVSADILDRYVATRAPDGQEKALYMGDAQAAINAKPDGMRIFAQAAGVGVNAVGAYMLRKKSMLGAYLFGGMAAAFAAKALGMVVKGHLMPALLPAKGSAADSYKARLAYGPLAGPRGYMGAPHPFQSKPMQIGPKATGSVGAYGCTRTPVNPSRYMTPEPGKGQNCTPWPFQVGSQGGDCIDKVGRGPSWTAPRPMAPKAPQPMVPRTPSRPIPVPGPDDSGRPSGESPPLAFRPIARKPMPFQPLMPGGIPQQPRSPRPGGVSPSRFSPVDSRRSFTQTGTRPLIVQVEDRSGYQPVK